jgi:cytochrome c biogenesis protein CcdA
MSQVEENRATNKSGSRSTVVASLAALGSVIAASSCCLPLLPFLFAAGAAGTSAFFTRLRPYLLILSVLLIAFGLQVLAGETMQLQAQQDHHIPLVVLGDRGVCIHLFSAGYRQPGGRSAGR